jgi:hypothetical protein
MGAKKDVKEEGTMGHFTRILVLTFFLTTVAFGLAFAEVPYTDMFNAEYGTSGGYNYNPQLGSCLTCHSSGSRKNAYANDWRNNGYNFTNVESMDSDNDGFTNLDEIVAGTFPGDLNSKPAISNNYPIADAGPTQTVGEGVRVTLDGSNSSDPDDGIASYLWEQTDGPSVALSSTTAVRPTFTTPNVGVSGESLIFQLTVTDNGYQQSTDTCIVNVTWINEPPTANAGFDQTANEGVTVTLDASNSMDLDDGIASYQWIQLGNNTRVRLSSDTAEQPTFTAPNVGGISGEALTFQLTVTDNGNLISTDTCIVNVTWINEPPFADAGSDQNVAAGDTVTLDGSGSSDVDDGIGSYLWKQEGGTSVTLSGTTATQPTFTAPNAGANGDTLTFELTVTDKNNLKTTDICVVNVAPVVPDPAPDTTAPIISNVQVTTITDTTALIEWTTDEPADSMLEYGTQSASWGSYEAIKNNADMVINHNITLTVLLPDTDYYFQVGSTDAHDNGPTISAEASFMTVSPPDTNSPSITGNPTIDYASATMDLTFNEPNMKNATIEGNYRFSPSLLFGSLGGSDDISHVGNNTYRLSMSYIPRSTIFQLTLSNVTDQAGNLVSPATVVINDIEKDGMADDWEKIHGVTDPNDDPDVDELSNSEEFSNNTDPASSDTDGDSLPDGWEVTYGLDPNDGTGINGGSGDLDNDGWTNYDEYFNAYNPADDNSPSLTPPEIVRSIPRQDSGIENGKRVPTDTAFAVRIKDDNGIDITDTTSVRFTVNDGVNQEYVRDLSDGDVVRVVKLFSGTDTQTRDFWIVYDRTNDVEYGSSYPFDSIINIKVDARDIQETSMAQANYNFKIESQEQKNKGKGKRPNQNKTTEAGITTLTVTSGDDLNGFELEYESDEPVTPYVKDSAEIPSLDLEGVAPVGAPVNLGPPNVFNNPVTLNLPVPGDGDPGELHLYLYDGVEWNHASSSYNRGGEVLPGGDGWIVPGSLVYHDDTEPPTLEVKVNHFSAAQAAFVDDATGIISDIDPDSAAGCFIEAINVGFPSEPYLLTLLFLAVVALTGIVRFGGKLKEM